MDNHQLSLYESLAEEISQMIKNRVLVPGDRLPSVRKLAQKKQYSISTVTQAMRLLESRGLIDVKPQAGYFVRHKPRPLNAPDSNEFKIPTYVDISNGLTQILKANAGPSLVQLGKAWLPDDLLPIKRLQAVISNVARNNPSLLGSPSFFDLNEASFVRQLVLRADWGDIDPGEVIVTNSGTEALSLCLRLIAQPGDTIAIESPCHMLTLQLIQTLGMKALEIPTHPTTGVVLEALELALRQGMVKAVMMQPNASNPMGFVMSVEKKRQLAAMLETYQVPMIENDVYGDLCFATDRPPPVKAFDKAGNVLLCSSFSKVIGPALSAGYIMAGKFAHKMIFMKSLSSGPASHFKQAVMAGMISSPSYNSHLRHIRRVITQRIAQTSDAVAKAFPQSCSISEPQGGFVLWVQLPQHVDSFKLHTQAVENGIAFMPGPLFSPSGKYSNFMRLNCGNAWCSEIDAAIKKLGQLVRNYEYE
ncbi:PLP-dependent aminotransferase family protein [Massilia sp. W12]|uniref:aminotransferase-like domain-containing protein n=1 Tax=Massilia sp. W12 TaxID=3126507 RepID=UPI0030CCAE61